jgi:hypothetical protein
MADQYRDTCVDRQNKNRKSFRGNPVDPIRVSFYDKDGTRVNDVTRSEANCIARLDSQKQFFYQDGNGYQRELLIGQVNALSFIDTLPNAPACPTNPQLCGPPKVQFFGGMGMGAMANAVISPNSNAIIGFDIVNPGFNYLTPPFANLIDECGNGYGGTLKVQTRPYSGGDPQKSGLEIKNIVITAPGDGYLPAPDGSLGGNGRVWKGANEGYVEKSDGSYYVVPSGQEPPNLSPGDKFIPPQPPTQPGFQTSTQPGFQTPTQPGFPTPTQPGPQSSTYPAITEIEEVFIVDPGFGYEPGDTLEVIPNNGVVLEPVINDRGEITQVKVISPGIGFIDLPEIIINSPRGYNAKLIPVLKVTPIANIPDPTSIPAQTQIVSVVDCVGKVLPRSQFDIIPR